MKSKSLLLIKSIFVLVFGILNILPAHSEALPIYVVAFAQDDLANDFRRAQMLDAQARADTLPNVRFLHSDAEGQTSLLIDQIDGFIQSGVDALIIGTNDRKAVVPVIEKAYQAGIQVIILDRGVDTEQYSVFVNSDNVAIGTRAGLYIAEQLQGKGRVLLLEGIEQADVTRLRSQGFLEVMAAYPGIEIVRRHANFLRKDALQVMEQLVADQIHVDAIFSQSDSMLSGVRPVLQRNGIAPQSILMVGCDYISEAREAIRQGTQAGSVVFPLGGREAMDVAVALLRGEIVPKYVQMPAGMLVTRDNVEMVEPVF